MNTKYDIFEIGKRYRVKQAFMDGIYSFISGEILLFRHGDLSLMIVHLDISSTVRLVQRAE
jgi:hypothetical protein